MGHLFFFVLVMEVLSGGVEQFYFFFLIDKEQNILNKKVFTRSIQEKPLSQTEKAKGKANKPAQKANNLGVVIVSK